MKCILSRLPSTDEGTYGIAWIDGIRGLVRPALTIILTFAALVINLVVLDKLISVWDTVTPEARLVLTTSTVEWVLFQASIAIGWWFAHRPSSKNNG